MVSYNIVWDGMQHRPLSDLVGLPDASELLPARQVASQCRQRVLHVVLDRLHQDDDVRVGRHVVEEREEVGLVLVGHLLRRRLDTAAVHPANEALRAEAARGQRVQRDVTKQRVQRVTS